MSNNQTMAWLSRDMIACLAKLILGIVAVGAWGAIYWAVYHG